MTTKHLRKCAIEKCTRKGETQRSYYLCGAHWVMAKYYAVIGDSKMDYMTHHAGHGNLSEEHNAALNEIRQLAAEINQ